MGTRVPGRGRLWGGFVVATTEDCSYRPPIAAEGSPPAVGACVMALAAVERSARFSSLAAASDARNRRQRVASRGLVRRRRVGSTARRRSAHLHGRPSYRAKTDAVSKDVVGASGSLPASTRARIFTRLTAPRPGYEVSRRSAAADRRATPHARRY